MSEWPPRVKGPMWKPSRTATKVAKHRGRMASQKKERDHKAEAKKRDGYRCRFPLCGCSRIKLALEARIESSHDKHKGSGGNPAGDRSVAALLMTLCKHRHQDGAVSRHKGTLRSRYLTDQQNNGPVAWDVDVEALMGLFEGPGALPKTLFTVIKRNANAGTGYVEVARERAIQQLAPLEAWQRSILEALADMTI